MLGTDNKFKIGKLRAVASNIPDPSSQSGRQEVLLGILDIAEKADGTISEDKVKTLLDVVIEACEFSMIADYQLEGKFREDVSKAVKEFEESYYKDNPVDSDEYYDQLLKSINSLAPSTA